LAGLGLGGEACNGTGRPLAQRLLADGEFVVDVLARLSAKAGLLDTSHNRKTDATRPSAVVLDALFGGGDCSI
jgi:transposase